MAEVSFPLSEQNKDLGCRLLIISELLENAVQKFGDIVGIFEGNHKFSPDEISKFKIINVYGFSEAQAEVNLETLAAVEDVAYRTTAIADKWSRIEPEVKEVWKNQADGKWYAIGKFPKFKRRLAKLVIHSGDDGPTILAKQAKLDDLVDDAVSKSIKAGHIEDTFDDPFALEPSNNVEETDLNP